MNAQQYHDAKYKEQILRLLESDLSDEELLDQVTRCSIQHNRRFKPANRLRFNPKTLKMELQTL